jgi:hypothetical protein
MKGSWFVAFGQHARTVGVKGGVLVRGCRLKTISQEIRGTRFEHAPFMRHVQSKFITTNRFLLGIAFDNLLQLEPHSVNHIPLSTEDEIRLFAVLAPQSKEMRVRPKQVFPTVPNRACGRPNVVCSKGDFCSICFSSPYENQDGVLSIDPDQLY